MTLRRPQSSGIRSRLRHFPGASHCHAGFVLLSRGGVLQGAHRLAGVGRRRLAQHIGWVIRALPAVAASSAAMGLMLVAHARATTGLAARYVTAGNAALAASARQAAELYYQRALQEQPGHPDAQMGLAKAALARGDGRAARRIMERIASPLRPGHVAAHLWLAKSLAAERPATAAKVLLVKQHLEQVLNQQPTHQEAVTLHAQLCLAGGRPQDAVPHLEPVYGLHPSLALMLGQAYLALGDPSKSRPPLERAAREYRDRALEDPGNIPLRCLWAEAQILLGDFQSAREILAAGLASSGDPHYRQALAHVMVAESDLLRRDAAHEARALELLEVALRTAPDDVQVLHRWSVLIQAPGPHRDRLRERLRDLLTHGKASAEVHLLAGSLAAHERDFESAARHFRMGLVLAPRLATLLNNYAWSLSQLDPPQWDEALRQADLAVAAAPANPEILETRGQILAGLGRWPEAIADLEKALPQLPDRPEIHETLARSYAALGKAGPAARHRDAAKKIPR